MSEAWIRIVIYETDIQSAEEIAAMKANTQRVVSILRSQPGFSSGYWGHDPKTGRMSAVTYWNSSQAIDDAGKALAEVREERKRIGVKVHSIHTFQLYPAAVDIGWDYDEAPAKPEHRFRVGSRHH